MESIILSGKSFFLYDLLLYEPKYHLGLIDDSRIWDYNEISVYFLLIRNRGREDKQIFKPGGDPYVLQARYVFSLNETTNK